MTIDRATGRGRAAAARRALALPMLLLLEVAAVLGLHQLGRIPALRIPWGDFGRQLGPWLAQSPLEQVLGAVLRNVALVAAWWLLASTGLYLLASLARAPALIRGAARVTLPAVRRAADGAVAVALATSLLSATTTAAVAATPTARSGPSAPVQAVVARRGPAALQAGPTTTQEPAKPGYTPGAAGLGQPASTTTSTAAPASTTSTTAPRQAPPPAAAPRYTPGAAGLGRQTTSTTTTSSTSTSSTSTSSTSTTTTKPPTPATTTRPPTTTAGGTTTTSRPPAPSGGIPPNTARPPGYVPSAAGPPPPTTTPPSGKTPSKPVPSSAGLHQVATGENLWEIARGHLASATGRDAAEIRTSEVAVYWLRVLAANRARLRSGNPNLIYPGEHVRLPAVRRSS